jgi:chemotaxis protein CheD
MNMKHVVGVADMRVSADCDDMFVTHALGSCLGVTMYDKIKQVGGMLHVMMPISTLNPDKAKTNPYMFVDSSIPVMLKKMYEAGAIHNQLIVKVAGGSARDKTGKDRFSIGKRNYLMLRKVLWQYGLMLDSEDIGGDAPRTMYMDIANGRVWLNSLGQEKDL